MNLTVRSRLLIGFGILLLLLGVTALLMTNKLSESNERLKSIVNVSGQKVNLSYELMISVLNATRFEKNLILEQDGAKRQAFMDNLNKAIRNVDEKTDELEQLVDAEGLKILKTFKSTWTAFRASLDSVLIYSQNNDTENAFQVSTTKGRQLREDAISQLRAMADKNLSTIQLQQAENEKSYASAITLILAIVITSLLIIVAVSYWIIKSISGRIAFISKEAEKIASREFTNEQLTDNARDELSLVFGSLVNTNLSFREITQNADTVASGDYSTDFEPRSDKDLLGHSLRKMTISLRTATAANERHNWLTTGQKLLNEKLIGEQSLAELSNNTISFLCGYLNASIGAIYLRSEKTGVLELSGSYAFSSQEHGPKQFTEGEGLIGQAARDQQMFSLSDISEEQVRITSAVLNAKPRHVLICPFLFEKNTLGVIEVGRLTSFTESETEFLRWAMDSIGVGVNAAIARKKIQELLEETQVQSEELQSQQEELRQVNEELEEQAQNLKQQQEELQMTNEELEEQTQSLEVRNREVEAARVDIEQKTKQLELSSKYKSEFLANMSHELRTPLNSLLILSKDLSENKKRNLDDDQVESAEIIHKSGTELLNLINEVLDLSKIEAGKMTVNVERLSLRHFMDELLRDFKHQADKKSLVFTGTLAADLPDAIRTDRQRLNQIMKNLLSNALKFTEKGSVSINIERSGNDHITISVADTGIGVPEDKRLAIFEAFQQADGGTARKYGGTGLGLSISRELARLLRAELHLSSKVNEGSVFSVTIPIEYGQDTEPAIKPASAAPAASPSAPVAQGYLNYPALPDDRASIADGDKIVLVIEDDLQFAGILLKLSHSKGFRGLHAATGEDGLALTRRFKPTAILLDLDLPGMDGHHVLTELKNDPAVRHIPVHIVSVNERSMDPIKAGAVEYLVKPVAKKDLEDAFGRIEHFVNRKMKNLLIIEDDSNSRKAMRKLIGNGDVKCLEAATGAEALDLYSENHIDCIVLDIGLPDISGFELIRRFEKVDQRVVPPIIIYTGKELTKEENEELNKHAESIIIKGVRSEERLLDETALFLHRTISNLPESKRVIINNLYDKEAIFSKRTVLLVDDDMRNVFALSKILKERGMNILKAENGKVALEVLAANPGIDIVLMDIMMPEMDGYEAMQRIRAQSKYKNLPVLALTAKAMKDDKQKCIDAGANDYVTKPVDVERLLTLMRVWLSR